MKIAVSAEGPDLTAQVGHRLGTAPYLIIVDTQTMAFEAVSNPAAGSKGGAGVMAVVLCISKDVDAVLTGSCSPTAMRYLSENGIDVQTGISATVADALEQYKKLDMQDTGDAIKKIKLRKTHVDRSTLVQALKSSIYQIVKLVPIFMAVILSIGLFITFISEEILSQIFSGNPALEMFWGAWFGSILAGNPINSYVIGGELLEYGVSLFAVTSFITAWVTVGLAQLPAEIAALGKKFALVRNAVAFVMSLVIAALTVTFFYYFAG
ncbi:MAG: NifB/NifX family molybdenum-iron cluster-binding protein [Desulfobacteraceae bacterium]